MALHHHLLPLRKLSLLTGTGIDTGKTWPGTAPQSYLQVNSQWRKTGLPGGISKAGDAGFNDNFQKGSLRQRGLAPRAAGDGSSTSRQRGFGSPTKKTATSGGKSKQKERQQEQVENLVERVSQEKGGKLNIDPEEAARGKVDFVRVDNWGRGTGEEEELGELQLKSFSPAYSAGDSSGPFYEVLVKRLQLLDSKGELAVVQATPLPPFERWSFGGRRYLQYLVDQLAIHRALESALALVLANNEEAASQPSIKALDIFGEKLGLHRSQAIEADVNALWRLLKEREKGGGELPEATTQTTAHAKYIAQLARKAATRESAAESLEAQHHFLAHIFAIHVSHLTQGMRIGSKAVTDLPIIREAQALSFYRDYPRGVGDPLRLFIDAINEAGELLHEEDAREQVMEELPRAIQKAGLLLAVIAVVEELEPQAG